MAWLHFEEPRVASESRNLLLRNGDAVPVRWVRDARARRLRLIVNDRGVRLTLPRSASVRLAETFLFEHRDWIALQMARHPPLQIQPFCRELDTTLLLRGEPLAIEWREGRYARAELTSNGLVLTQPASGSARQLRSALKEFYLQQARIDLGRWLPKYLPGLLPMAPVSVKYRALSSLWGSLSPGNAVSLDLALVLGRSDAHEYVLVHELCHLLQRNHSRRFWREVEARWPGWREERNYLHGDGLAIKAELRRLTAA